MKVLSRIPLAVQCFAILSYLQIAAQLPERSIYQHVTGSSDPNLELEFASRVSIRSTADYLKYGVSSSLTFERGFGQILICSTNRLSFATSQVLGPNSLIYANSSGYTWAILLQTYSWEVRFPGNQIFVNSGLDLFPGETNIILGFSRQHPYFAGTQYGWVRLDRETADTKAAFRPDGTARQLTFLPTAFAVNPIPDQPIRAGEPPDLPQLVSELLPPEEGLPTRVRVSWAAGWANMRLESAVELANPVQWSPVSGVNGTEAVLELPEDGQLYLRLAYAP